MIGLMRGGVCRWPRKGVAGRGLVSGSRQDERSSGELVRRVDGGDAGTFPGQRQGPEPVTAGTSPRGLLRISFNDNLLCSRLLYIFAIMDTEKFKNFILEHENDDPARLLLSKGKWKDIDTGLAANTIISRKKLKGKVPEWYAEAGLIFPSSLSAEQCSSQATAEYKARLARRLYQETLRGSTGKAGSGGMRIADLTGGLGVDSRAFSKTAEHVLYNEMNPLLADAAAHNFRLLGAGNIAVSCKALEPGSLEGILGEADTAGREENCQDTGFCPDIIYLDPARRDDAGRKVFLLEDCRPDILKLKEELLAKARFVIVKLSPMADISMVTDRLGGHCREMHIVSSGGECKELLAVLDREYSGECVTVAACNAGKDNAVFTFCPSEEKYASAEFPASQDEVMSAGFLFEPDKALMKSGAFNLISERFHITKLSRNTHLYIFNAPEAAAGLSGYGKVYTILKVFPMNKAGIRQAASEFQEAEVTARNIHMSSEQLRKRLGVRSGDRIHIFGAEYLIVTER